MLAKKFRLPIQEVLGQKFKTARNEYFAIKSRPNDLGFSRFGTVISRKVSKSAVKRNKIKRVIFNFIRLNKLHFKSPQQNKFATGQAGTDFLIIISPKANQLTKNETQEELKSLILNLKS